MAGKQTRGTLRVVAFFGVVLYAAVMVVSPFEHHDIVCHLKTPQHCTSCATGALGSAPVAVTSLAAGLVDAGCAIAFLTAVKSVVLAVRSTGRSPPVSA
jgi:hypothetical protein